MSLPIEFKEEAETELEQAHEWYNQQRSGLGDEFLTEVRRVLNAVSKQPFQHAVVAKDVRKAVFRRFPYAIFYQPLADRIRVMAVFHAKRDPRQWRERI